MKKNKTSIKNLLLLIFLLSNAWNIQGQIVDDNILPNSQLEKNEVRFAVIGDAGTGGKNQAKVAQQLLEVQRKTNFNLLLFLGDNVYENGSPKDFEKKLVKPYSPLFLRGVEFRGAIGNHDARSKNGVIMQQMIFNMGIKTYYSFNKGNNLIDYFAINSTDLAKGRKPQETKEQLEWFENKLAKSEATWKIVFMHHPIYSSAGRHGLDGPDEDEMLRVRELLEPLYIKYGVNISLNGHDHVYERTKPQKGIIYFTSGAGAKLRKGDLKTNSPFYAYGNDKVRSFMLFSVKSDSIRFWAIGIEGDILDSGIINSKS